MAMLKYTVVVLLLLLTIDYGSSSRSIKENSSLTLSDGMDQQKPIGASVSDEVGRLTTTVTCQATYGFLPCTTKVWGKLFLLVIYEYLLSLAQKYVARGSNLFFRMFGTGLFGAGLFNILAVFPQIMLILVGGASSNPQVAQSMAGITMGLLTGSPILMLTLVLGSIIAFGSYDLSDTDSPNPDDPDTSTAPNTEPDTEKPFSLTGFGVRTDIETKYSAIFMLFSMIPFLILLVAKFLSSAAARRVVFLVALIVSFVFLVLYITYQVFQPWIQDRRLEYLFRKFIQDNLLGRLLTRNGRPDVVQIRRLFHRIDTDNDSFISPVELRAFILGVDMEEVGLDEEDFSAKILEEFDFTADGNINEAEFVRGISNWLRNANNDANDSQGDRKLFHFSLKKNDEQQQNLLPAAKNGTTRKIKLAANTWWNYSEAAFFIILGTAVSVLIANPLMTTIREFSTSININSFVVSYVVVPLALNFRPAFKAITSAMRKSDKAASLTFVELYTGTFMGNSMGLVIFLSLVYIRDIQWAVSAEVPVVFIICTVMGLFNIFSTKIELWTCILVYLLYPISLLLIYVLNNVLGW
ncbi:Sodium/calcium exchanger membrane region [Corchorus capsularis]|uniref:Sodium/calcium exchanger membrane region n=1 Tax=Corchorus capsularis TaxID=210143 RepID=A0A1R3I159_COCAP|nr:Sodium/calcium exchanger membrane region [Corchorus capsularis]